MPNRIVRDGILTSKRVNQLSLGAELFYRRLMSVVDDHGRYHADPSILLSGTWPRNNGQVTVKDVSTWLDECTSGADPLVSVYEANGDTYLEINNFRQRTRQEKSKFPEPAHAVDGHMSVNSQSYDRHMTVIGQSIDSKPPLARAGAPHSPSSTNTSTNTNGEESAREEPTSLPQLAAAVRGATPDADQAQFEAWWRFWSSVRGTNHRDAACRAWLSVASPPKIEAIFFCTASYLASLENPAKGYNPENFLFDQARDNFEARWPEKRAGPEKRDAGNYLRGRLRELEAKGEAK